MATDSSTPKRGRVGAVTWEHAPCPDGSTAIMLDTGDGDGRLFVPAAKRADVIRALKQADRATLPVMGWVVKIRFVGEVRYVERILTRRGRKRGTGITDNRAKAHAYADRAEAVTDARDWCSFFSSTGPKTTFTLLPIRRAS